MMKITYLGHAAIFLETNGTSILMDPWLTDGAYLGSWWHFPPLVLGIRDLPRPDVIYISHEHADHFDPATLEQADRSSRVVIANFRNKRFRDRIAGLGFRDIVELDFGTTMRLGDRLDIQLIAPDRVWDDSAILLRDGECSVLNVNDAHLDEATLTQLSENDIDLAFITFAGASQYPGCFELPPEEKRRRSLRSKRAHLDEFVRWAQLLKTKRVVPAAGNYALLAPDQLPLNTGDYVGTPKEALEALAHRAPEIEGIQMNPADEWTPAGGLRRANPAPDWDRRLELIDELSHVHAAEIAASLAAEKPAPEDLYERFRDYFTAIFTAHPEIPRQVNLVVWWTAVGPAEGDWVIDFTRARDWIYRGVPSTWNLHITIPDRLIAAGLAEEVPWEHLVLSFRARIARNPDRYLREFWEWFGRLPGRKYLL
jgi:UDP-MurNAc hydroxylase